MNERAAADGGIRTEPTQRDRFGPVRASPPPRVLDALGCGPTGWSTTRLGSDGGFPNGGMWRSRHEQDPAAAVVVKRTGPHHLGTDPVWRGSADPDAPQWWGREAEFYLSPLATAGWGPGARPARCLAVDDHDDVRDLWLEAVAEVPLTSEHEPAVVAELARWQQRHQATAARWLSRGWIADHLRRRRLDNARTSARPEWDRLLRLGVDPRLREEVAARITDPAAAAAVLDRLPQVLTHHDLHHRNLGRNADEIVIFDWATVGWGPVGHDVGLLLIDRALELDSDLGDAWELLVDTYVVALQSAGSALGAAEIGTSVVASNVIRHGWLVDYVLDLSPGLDDDQLLRAAGVLLALSDLWRQHGGAP